MNSTPLEFNFYYRCNLITSLKVLNNALMFKTQFPVTCQERINPFLKKRVKKGFSSLGPAKYRNWVIQFLLYQR